MASVILYLLPFQVLKYLLPASWMKFFDFSLHMDYFDGFEKSMVVTIGENDYWIPDTIILLEIIWLIIILLFSITQFILYECRVMKMKHCSTEMKVYIKGMGEQRIYVTEGVDTPYTVGFFRPFIVIPGKMLSEECLDLVYRHEVTHLRKHDSLVKLICLITFCIHWFNPAALINLFLYERFAEFLADREAVKECSEREKKDYIKLMLQLASHKDKMPIVWKNNFFTTRKMMEWRIQIIMKNRTKRKIIASLLAVVISVMFSATTILAYTPLQSSSGTNKFISENKNFAEFSENDKNASIDCSSYDQIFISDDNERYPITEDDYMDTRALCIHEFVTGVLNSHEPNNSGGCTMYVYDAKKCIKCNYLVVNDLLYTATYNPCPH